MIDNDKGAKGLFNYIKGVFGIADPQDKKFIHLFRNLYVIPTPLGPDKSSSTIEDFFSDDVKNTLVAGKSFKPKKDHDDQTGYGKVVFAHKVVKPNANKIDFSNFKQLLRNISEAIEGHYKTHPAP